MIQAGDAKLDQIADAISSATKRIKKTEGKAAAKDPGKILSVVKGMFAHFTQGKQIEAAATAPSDVSNALSRPQVSQPIAPTAPTGPNAALAPTGANNNDPLGILGR